MEAAAASGRPFTKIGESGLFKQRTLLPDELSGMSRGKLEALADTALERGAIVAAIATGSTIPKWLDVPGGTFALGLGEFRKGATR